jgi:hypothetical protein
MSRFPGGVLALLALCGTASGQTVPIVGLNQPDAALTIKLGDGTLKGSRVAPHHMAWVPTFFPSKSAPIVGPGLWTENVRVAQWNGRRVLVRSVGAIVYGSTALVIRGYIAHVAVVDAETLAPIWSEHHDMDGSSEKWIFEGTHVEVHKTGSNPGDKDVVTRFDTGIPAYDFTGPMFPFYFKALPLKVGLSGVIPAVGETPEHPLRGVKFTVLGHEKIKDGSRGLVDAWVVESIDPSKQGTIRFWIADTESYPIRMEIRIDPRESYDMLQ